jgi:hypothetical protein
MGNHLLIELYYSTSKNIFTKDIIKLQDAIQEIWQY